MNQGVLNVSVGSDAQPQLQRKESIESGTIEIEDKSWADFEAALNKIGYKK